MSFKCLFLLQLIFVTTLAAGDVVELKPFRAAVSYVYLNIEYVTDTDEIAEMRVNWVAPGSTAEKVGLRRGDRLMAINGASVAGMKRGDVLNESGGVIVRGKEVTVTGQRGLFRRKWSITATIDSSGKWELKEENKEPHESP